MKRMKNIGVFLVFLVMFALAACRESIMTGTGNMTGTVLLSVGAGGRTLHPVLDGLTFKLSFVYDGKDATHDEVTFVPEVAQTVELGVGTWTINAAGYSETTRVALGQASVTVTAGSTQSVTIHMGPDLGTSGTLAFSIALPEGVTGTLTVQNAYTGVPASAIGNPVTLMTGTNTGTLTLSPNVYCLYLDAKPDETSSFADLTEIAHIYQGLVTNFTYNPTAPVLESVVDILDLTPYFVAPATGKAAQGTTIQTAEYSGTLTWKLANGTVINRDTFAGSTVYMAVINLTPKEGWTLDGLVANSFTYEGASSVVYSPTTKTVAVTFPATDPEKQTGILGVTAGYTYNDFIIIGGNDGTNLIKKAGMPESVTFTAPSDYEDIKWYLGSSNVGTGTSVTVHANGNYVGTHTFTFTGRKKSTNVYNSQQIPINIEAGNVNYYITQVGGKNNTATTQGIEFTFTEALSSFSINEVQTWGVSGSAKNVNITGSATKWTLWISDVVQGTLGVIINKEGVSQAINYVTVYTHNVPTGFRLVQAGTFQMGKDDSNAGHTVTLSKSFLISDHEVTKAEWKAIMGSAIIDSRDPHNYENDDAIPIHWISWYHAIAYCNKLSIKDGFEPVYSVSGVNWNTLGFGDVPTGDDGNWNAATWDKTKNGYRLPTEAEWEFAARGGLSSKGYTYSGSNDVYAVAYMHNNLTVDMEHNWEPLYRPEAVKLKSPNELGLYDMTGNVTEYVWDRWGDLPTTAETDPEGPTGGNNRVSRGGSWNDYPYDLKLSSRKTTPPNYYDGGGEHGFRLATNY